MNRVEHYVIDLKDLKINTSVQQKKNSSYSKNVLKAVRRSVGSVALESEIVLGILGGYILNGNPSFYTAKSKAWNKI
jgi:hypothetical protein